ncbi:MAG: N-methylhydantoinase [Acidimicrobiaceae bacterium]|nr:N-methylhydantoinase [Acidimicrobiaceae bacterium]
MVEQDDGTGPMGGPDGIAVDGATAGVIHRYLLASAEEMRTTLVRTAFNPVIYEVLDFGISIYDENLDLLAEAPGITSFLGANDYAIRRTMEHLGPDSLDPGDVVLMNYPYWNSAHAYDATLFGPAFCGQDHPFMYLCVRAHWMDLGAKDPGYVLDSTDVHQEGMLFPGTKVFRRYEESPEIMELLRFNSRMPDLIIGDLHAQVSAIRTGERRVGEIVERFGPETVNAVAKRLYAEGEATTRAALRALPQGSWTAEDWADGDVNTREPLRLKVTVTIEDGEIIVDFAGSHGTAVGPVNLPFGSTLAMCKVALKGLTSPYESANAGHSRPLTVKAEPGSLFHAVYPAPTFTQWTHIVAFELIYKALSAAMPEQVSASSGGDMPGFMMVGIHPETGQLFAVSNNEVVGWGGTSTHDGNDVTIHPSESIVRNTPLEVLEQKTTMLIERLEMRTDSGGPGLHRGGVGLERVIRFLGDGEFLNVVQKTISPPWPIGGGMASEPNRILAYAGTDEARAISIERIPVRTGDRVVVRTAGGAGHGDPRTRTAERVRWDVEEGYVSIGAAIEHYGVTPDQLGIER